MNGCWEEARIEAAALRWVARRAIGAGDDSEETGRLLDHARMCVRCRELFELFVETEWRAAAIGAETLRDEARTYRLIDLIELPEEAALGAGGGEWGSPRFSLAARDPGSSYGDAEVPQSPRAFASADGRFLVRVLPNEAEPGATAVLLAATAPLRGARAYLREEDREIPFDEAGQARLPGMPEGRIRLRLAWSAGPPENRIEP